MLSNRSVTTLPDVGSKGFSRRAVGSHLVGLPAGKRIPIAPPEPADRPSVRSAPVDVARTPVLQEHDELTNLERTVVELSLRDSPHSTGRPSRRSQFFDMLLGRNRPNRLADPRLEGLREYAMLLRSGNVEAITKAKDRMTQLGFTDNQARAVQALVEARIPGTKEA